MSAETGLIIILIERKLASKFSTIQKPLSSKVMTKAINHGDIAYLDHSSIDTALECWSKELHACNHELDKLESQSKIPLSYKTQHTLKVVHLKELTMQLAHKIFYACLINYKVGRLLEFIEDNLKRANSSSCNQISVFENIFK
jgi:hypothetical protein